MVGVFPVWLKYKVDICTHPYAQKTTRLALSNRWHSTEMDIYFEVSQKKNFSKNGLIFLKKVDTELVLNIWSVQQYLQQFDFWFL